MSLSQDRGLVEKLEHSIIVDLLQIGVYLYFGYIAYINVDLMQEGELLDPLSMDPTIKAVQLAGILAMLNILMLLHDKTRSKGGIH